MNFKPLLFSLVNLVFVLLFFQNCQCVETTRPVILNTDLVKEFSKHLNLYVSSDFDIDEVDEIENAAREWQDKSQGIITFSIYFNFDTKNDYDKIKRNANTIVVVKLSKDSEWVRNIDGEINKDGGGRIVGYYNTND